VFEQANAKARLKPGLNQAYS